MKRLFFLPLLAFSLSALEVDAIYQSHLVLQQGRPVPISGTASGSEAVVVSFGDQKVEAKVKKGRWQAVLAPMAAQAEGAPLSITQGSESVVLEDVVVGEVWLASGQSNMFYRLEETPDKAAQQHPEIPGLRFYQAEPQVETPRAVYNQETRQRLKDGDMYRGSWSVSSPKTAARTSAVGWYFGKRLQSTLGVPVGIIHVSYGGSEMLAWMPHDILAAKYPESLKDNWMHDANVDPYWVGPRAALNQGKDLSTPHPYTPGYLYKTGITPWFNFPIAGIIWYQGESDAPIPNTKRNHRVLTDLINAWRRDFKAPELPFLMVQLPRIKDTPRRDRVLWPEFRDVQSRVSRELPKVYRAVTIDLGTTNYNVHPPRKLEVGERLAAIAAAEVYGKDVPCYGPSLDRVVAKGDRVALHLHHAEGLRTTNGAAPACFEISADGKTYHPATAELQGETVLLSSSEVKKPKFVRYAWATFVEPNLVNAAGLPMEPFGGTSVGRPKK